MGTDFRLYKKFLYTYRSTFTDLPRILKQWRFRHFKPFNITKPEQQWAHDHCCYWHSHTHVFRSMSVYDKLLTFSKMLGNAGRPLTLEKHVCIVLFFELYRTSSNLNSCEGCLGNYWTSSNFYNCELHLGMYQTSSYLNSCEGCLGIYRTSSN